MLFHLSHFSFLPPPLAPSPKAFPSSHVNYFLSEHTLLIPYFIHIFSSFLSFSLPFFPRYSLTLILLWALVNSVWFTCFDFFLLCFPLPAHSIFLSTEDTSHKVVIPVFATLSNYAFAHAISGGTGFRA